MINLVPPAAIFIVGALLIPLLKGKLKSVYMLLLPILAFINLINMPEGKYWVITFLNYNLIFGRVDRLSMVFGYIFVIISFIGILYALHVKDDSQHIAALLYAGSALGVTFAGDLFSLYIFWEIMALSSVILVWAQRTQKSRSAGFRYFMWHFFGGLCLLAGIVLYVHNRGTPAFDYIGLNDLASYLIFIGFCLNAVVFPFHAWLPDAYPEATVTGAVFMSALTTKSAVYILARTYPGTEILIWMGAFMTCFPIFYAVIVNDMRRVLAYSLINQVGFMICGIGIGTQLAINGAAAHAFCHIIYKALLFMSVGAVLHMTGKSRGTDLGGLYKTMPFTAVCCIIGAASISAFPLFSGFTSKAMTITAVANEHLPIIWFMLQFASAGVFHHAGIKVPYFTFFGEDSGIRAKEPPMNMRAAMGIAAFLCIFLGIYPYPLYKILPYAVDFVPYTIFHVVGMLQLLMFGALAFTILILSGYYPAELRAVHLDTDWFVRVPGKLFIWFCEKPLITFGNFIDRIVLKVAAGTSNLSTNGATILENGMDKFYHLGLTAIPTVIYNWIRPLRMEIGYIPLNLIYILISFIGFLFAMFLLGG
ncbi:MAG: Na(+)/H(+) antiporter subunit D [Thermodesulfobacteriota bacterium]|nr:Na(+)/H(+) antiporter subunit D [Thermodesulfobacteriota bacterium]